MSAEVLIRASNVGKRFSRNFSSSLRYGVEDVVRTSLGLKKRDSLRHDEFWAVREVSFELKRGECLGLIGHNGAGKSTLLKILNGIIAPDEGRIEIFGRVGALIELGAGFNPILTGRENIYNNGAVLGFSKKEIDSKLDEIIAFSEIEKFIDTPVQNYSSGMKVRLGFAVAANLDPDLLIIDEVLAVGDIGFRIKCYNKIASLLRNSAIIFVSHAMPQLAKISSVIILMDGGRTVFHGYDVSAGIDAYYNLFEGEQKQVYGQGIELEYLHVNGEDATKEVVECTHGESLEVSVRIVCEESLDRLHMGVHFFDKDLKPVATTTSKALAVTAGQAHEISFRIPVNQFSVGKFSIGCGFSEYTDEGVLVRVLKRFVGIANIVTVGLNTFTPATFELIGDWEEKSKS